MKYDVIIIGGGAAGLAAAGFAADRGMTVLIVEKNARPGRKVLITGKGRCNLTNNCDVDTLISSVTENQRFLYSAFYGFNSNDTMELFEDRLKVPLKTERGNRVFPRSDRAADIVDALCRFALKAKIINDEVTELITENGQVKGVRTAQKEYFAENVLISTGGRSYPLTGSTGDGYKFARAVGHSIVEIKPSLIPVEAGESFCKKAMGLSLKNVRVSVEDTIKQKNVFCEQGEMLFTHFGLSGPLILSGSAHMRPFEKDRFKVHIDLKPSLDLQKLERRLERDFEQNINRNFQNSLSKLLPAKLIPVVVGLSGISGDKKVNQITAAERKKLASLLKDLTVTVKKFRPVEEAIVTSGGVNVKEVDPKTMQSKLCQGLFFAGEVLDVDAYTGGFNLQIAFSTAHAAAKGFKKQPVPPLR